MPACVLDLPEILGSIIFFLEDDRSTLRDIRLVSRFFLAAANRTFRVHLTAAYAMDHNCVQQAAHIIGGLNFKHQPTPSPQNSSDQGQILDSIAFCSLVARNCHNLETVRIDLKEKRFSEHLYKMLSALFSQDDREEAVFRLKEVHFSFWHNLKTPAKLDIRRLEASARDVSAGIQPGSPFSRLEKLVWTMRQHFDNSHMYKILQCKVGSEVAAATRFLCPVFQGPATPLVPLSAGHRTLKIFSAPDTTIEIDQMYKLIDCAPALEELDILTINDIKMTALNPKVFVQSHSKRTTGSLRLRRLRMATANDTYCRLLLRLLDPLIVDTFQVQYCYAMSTLGPDGQSGVLNDAFIVKHQQPDLQQNFQGRIQQTKQQSSSIPSYRNFGFRTLSAKIGAINWIQVMDDNQQFHHLEELHLPCTVHQFLDQINQTSASRTSQMCTIPLLAEGIAGFGQQTPPFPAAASLRSLAIAGFDIKAPELTAGDGERLADILLCWMPRLRRVTLHRNPWRDFTFLEAIAPFPPPSPKTGRSRVRDGMRHLESLEFSLEFLTPLEFQLLPGHKKLTALRRRERERILSGSSRQFELLKEEIKAMEQQLLLDSQPIHVHDRRVEQFLEIMGRFQRRHVDVAAGGSERSNFVVGLTKVTVYQSGIPKIHVDRIKASCAQQFPRMALTIIGQYS